MHSSKTNALNNSPLETKTRSTVGETKQPSRATGSYTNYLPAIETPASGPLAMTWAEAVAEATVKLEGIADAALSAELIAQEASGCSGADWLEATRQQPTTRQLARFDAMVERRGVGEPIQYVLGRWGFRYLDLMIDHRVLIPRPETEIIAGHGIEFLRDQITRADSVTATTIAVDLGTGSGAIGLSIASELKGHTAPGSVSGSAPGSVEVWLTDIDEGALAVARSNLAGLGIAGGATRLAQGSWYEALPTTLKGRVSVIISNPPYVDVNDEIESQVADWEPTDALIAADGGMAHLKHLVDGAPSWLTAGGALILEMAPGQVERIEAQALVTFRHVEVIEDLAGRRRGLFCRQLR